MSRRTVHTCKRCVTHNQQNPCIVEIINPSTNISSTAPFISVCFAFSFHRLQESSILSLSLLTKTMAPPTPTTSRQTPNRSASTDSVSSAPGGGSNAQRANKQRECRRVVSAFTSDVLPNSEAVYGNNYFLPATVIMESSKAGCAPKKAAPRPSSSSSPSTP